MTLAAWMLATSLVAQSSAEIRIPERLEPDDPIEVYVDLTSAWDVVSFGVRLTYNTSRSSFRTLGPGASTPATWSAVYERTDVPGEVDVVFADLSAAQAIIPMPEGAEILRIVFNHDGSCEPLDFEFNPLPSDDLAAFPDHMSQYVLVHDTSQLRIVQEFAEHSTIPVAARTADHAFRRGNVADRELGLLDISDVVLLARMIFKVEPIAFSCGGALDVNNDNSLDIIDVVTLAHALFTAAVAVPSPFSEAGTAVLNGGDIESLRGCADGELCGAPDRTATLEWDPPAMSADGTVVDDLAGYRAYRKRSPDPCARWEEVLEMEKTTTAVTFAALVPGRHFFAVTAFDLAGNESLCSGVVSKEVW